MPRKKAPEPEASTPRGRDREGTEAAILAAARGVLASDGFQGFGVNAIARAAGCDKQLVYRYFGGVDGLVEAIGDDLASWWSAQLAPADDASAPTSYGALMKQLALAMLDALRADPLVQKIAAWELSETSPQVARLTAARSKAMMQWMTARRGSLQPPTGVDTPALNAIIIAGVQQLVLASATTGQFAGLPLKSDADWARVRGAVVALVDVAYSAGRGETPS